MSLYLENKIYTVKDVLNTPGCLNFNSLLRHVDKGSRITLKTFKR